MKRTGWFRTVIRIAPVVVLLIVIVYQRIPILTAPRPAKVISAAGLSSFSSCSDAAHSFLSSVATSDSTHEPAGPLTVEEAQDVASRVLARHQNNWLTGVYEFSASSPDQIGSPTGEPLDIWWLVTGKVTSDTSDAAYRTWRSEVAILYLDAVTGDPLLLVEKTPVEFRVDARLLVGSVQPCGATGDMFPPGYVDDMLDRAKQALIRFLPVFLLALYGLGWIGFYLVRKIRQREPKSA
jgi:hypothetical protein